MSEKKTRACWYKVESLEKGRPVFSEWKQGYLHAWSQHHEECETGYGNFPVAIVEDVNTSAVVVTFAGYVHFGVDPEVTP